MTLSTAIAALGTQIQVEDPATPGSYLDINNQNNVARTGIKNKYADTTHMKGQRAEEKLRTTYDPGQFTCDVFYNPNDAVHAMLHADVLSGTVRNYRYLLVGGTYVAAAGSVESFLPDAKADAALTYKLAIQLTGPATYGP